MLGLLPLPLSWAEPPDGRAALRGLLAVALCLVVSLGLAVLGGATAIGRDLALRRMGFWLARPLPGLAIWAAKLAAVWILVLLSLPLLLGPVLLLDGGEQMRLPDGGPLPELVAKIVLAAALLVPLAHAAGVSLRSRSGWLLFELGALLGFGLGGSLVIRQFLIQAGDFSEGLRLLSPHVVALVAAPVLTTALGAIVGRAELRRVHAAQAITLAVLLALTLLLATLRLTWIFSAEPRHLQTVTWVRPAPRGNWMEVSGYARDAFQHWLFDANGGRSIRITGPPPAFSADGRVAAWIEPDTLSPPYAGELLWVRLDDGARPGRGRLRLPLGYGTIALSPDGSRLAAVDGDRVLVVELASGRLLLAGRLPGGETPWSRLHFAGNDRALLLRGSYGRRDHFEIDVAAKRLSWAGVSAPLQLAGVSLEHDRLLAFDEDLATSLVLLEATSGLELWRHDFSPGRGHLTAGFVSGGRVVVCARHESWVRLLVFDAEGCVERESIIPIWSRNVQLAGEVSPGQVLLRVDWSPKTILVDLHSGAILRREEGIRPARVPFDPLLAEPLAAGSPGTRLFLDSARNLLEVDFATGSRRTILAMAPGTD